MGLDMYLTAEKMISPRREEEECSTIHALFPEIDSCVEQPFIQVKFEIGYWRKANHIHKWFVDNVQSEEDDQEEYSVYDCHLQKLLAVCKKVDEDHSLAEELLPTTSGFFFGCTDYEDYYFENIKTTIKIIEHALTLYGEYYLKYHGSW